MIWLGCNPSWRNLFQQSSTFKPSKGRTAGLGFPASCVWLLERWPTSWSMDVQHMPVNNQGIIQRKYGMYLGKYGMLFNYRVTRWVDLGWPKQDIHIIYIYMCVLTIYMVHIQKYMPCHGGYDHQKPMPSYAHGADHCGLEVSESPDFEKFFPWKRHLSYGNMSIYRVSYS